MKRNCKKCDIEHWCQNKDKEICVMELKKGDKITFLDSNIGKFESGTVTEISKTQNGFYQLGN